MRRKLHVAVLVHNGVMNDARVIKEATTLRTAGYQVVIHGISPTEQSALRVLPGTDIPVFLEPRVVAIKTKPTTPSKPTKPARSPVSGKLRYGLMWPLQLLELGLLGTLMWWCVMQLHDRYPSEAGEPALVGVALFLGALASSAFGRFRRHQWRMIGAWLSPRPGARTSDHQVVTPAPTPTEAPAPERRFHHFTEALLTSLGRHSAPDVIHLHDHIALTLARELKTRYDVPIVWDAHEIYEEMAGANPERARENAAIIAANHGYIDDFITINASIAQFYKEHYPAMPTAKLVMNATLAGPVPQNDGRLHAAAGLPRTQKILLFQGGFAPHRGLHQLIDAAPKLPSDWTLVLMGWGGLETELRALASQQARAGECQAVVFLPGVPQQELQQWTAGATLGVIPYENTGLNHLYCTPNKLWEYPAAGVPVLASDLVEMAAVLKAYPFGFLLPREFTSEDIVAAVTGLTAQKLAGARANAALFLEANNWSVWEQNLLAVYKTLGDKLADVEKPLPATGSI